MKALLFATLVVLATPGLSSGQSATHNNTVEQEIRKLDAAEVDAVLRKDVAALEKLWAEEFTVNNPRNEITNGRKEVLRLISNGLIDYSSFVREIEKMSVHGDTVVIMGLETVKPVGKAPQAGQTVRRRFTNIWIKRMVNCA